MAVRWHADGSFFPDGSFRESYDNLVTKATSMPAFPMARQLLSRCCLDAIPDGNSKTKIERNCLFNLGQACEKLGRAREQALKEQRAKVEQAIVDNTAWL